jgi:DNA-binding response OmpR family regulator
MKNNSQLSTLNSQLTTPHSPLILCVEDNLAVQMINKEHLEGEGYTVICAMTLYEAREAMKTLNSQLSTLHSPLSTLNLIILDIHLPDGNGLDFLRELRKTSDIPVIALTNNKTEEDIITGLSSGCDDYIPKPYTVPILCARVDALLRRAERVPEKITLHSKLSTHHLTLDLVAVQAFVNGTDILLSPKEFSLLLMFVQNENTVMSAEHIYEKVWKAPLTDNKNALEAAISSLRTKIKPSEYTIVTRRGQGYTFEQN